MRIEKRMVETERYVCEACGKEYGTHWEAAHCERVHRRDSCEHSNFGLEYSSDWESSSIEIRQMCKACDFVLGVMYLDDSDQACLRAVYEALKKLEDQPPV